MTREDRQAAAELAAAVVPPPTGPLRVVVSVRGRVRHGVESHSVVLHADDGRRFQLSGAYSRFSGRTVLVRGVVRGDHSTTTQQGVPLKVEAIETIDDGEPVNLS